MDYTAMTYEVVNLGNKAVHWRMHRGIKVNLEFLPPTNRG
jgi:hypothetical protein